MLPSIKTPCDRSKRLLHASRPSCDPHSALMMRLAMRLRMRARPRVADPDLPRVAIMDGLRALFHVEALLPLRQLAHQRRCLFMRLRAGLRVADSNPFSLALMDCLPAFLDVVAHLRTRAHWSAEQTEHQSRQSERRHCKRCNELSLSLIPPPHLFLLQRADQGRRLAVRLAVGLAVRGLRRAAVRRSLGGGRDDERDLDRR